MSKTVLHELLAVEQGLAETSKRLSNEVARKLSSKTTLFSGMVKSHQMFTEESAHLTQATEHVEVQSTVDAQLEFVGIELARYWDATLQKEEANQRAKADIIVNGVAIAKDVPAIVLLSLEKKLSSLLAIYNNIPTLDAAVAWEQAPSQGYGIYQTKHAVERFQTKTEKKFITVAPATDKHQAQITTQDEITNVGKFTQTNFSGMLTTNDKAKRIQRLVALTRSVKQARQRANSTTVNTELKIGSLLLNHINDTETLV